MASPILPALGLGSGLDTTAIVKALVDAEKTPKQNQIDRQTKANTASISAIGSLKSALATYKTALEKLGSSTTPQFIAYSATTADDKTVKATAGANAVNGSYNVVVNDLATASKVASQRFADSSAAISEGTLVIKQGTNGEELKVEIGAGATLQTVRDSINASLTSKGITANIINDGTGSRLVLTSTNTGAGSDISVSGITELEITGTTKMTGAGAGFITEIAKDASFTVDGMPLTSKSNKVENAVSGLTFELVAKTASTGTNITVGTNNDGLKKSVQSFVDAYNALVTTINSFSQTPKNADGTMGTAPALAGDSMVRGMLSALRNELVVPNANGNGTLKVLSQLGINTVQSTGLLELDSTKFTAAIDTQKLGGEIQKMFSGDDGLANRMTKALEPYTATDGLLADRSKILESAKKNLTMQQSSLDARITAMTTSLTKKYNTMDTLVGKLNAQRDNITSIFDAMSAQQKNS
ncbi:flagellar filament capping protein FliD [Pseudomonas sp. 148P]|uniref:Flagellar hook-associated protein 2 n=1 Tax=Pseudomonas ulcerans TaxID=3115852 RepID=A0ABU7HXA7_9PSED|nr:MULTISPECIES: flagellar filament capping protein FliD [unclassified Pseudomonas]MEE1920396.1 flagellar filament capping protein FliD [Pseudomonas sp. 147P]MEE1936187.1 flagellar filament capping protein FliD [Pseudomonas sp. 148P]